MCICACSSIYGVNSCAVCFPKAYADQEEDKNDVKSCCLDFVEIVGIDVVLAVVTSTPVVVVVLGLVTVMGRREGRKV